MENEYSKVINLVFQMVGNEMRRTLFIHYTSNTSVDAMFDITVLLYVVGVW